MDRDDESIEQWQIDASDITICGGRDGRLGAGGQATVFRGEYGVGRQAVAMKELHVGAFDGVETDTMDFFEEFGHEAAVLAKMSHPNIVQLIGHCEPVLALEALHVEERVARDTAHEEELAVVPRQLLSPPAAAHEHAAAGLTASQLQLWFRAPP